MNEEVWGYMYKYGTIIFEWDESKEFLNLSKHKISFAEAAETFLDPDGIEIIDEKHSNDEKRSYWVGEKSDQTKILTTWFTRRENCIRIIGSAEWRKFRRFYETTKYKKYESE